MEQRRKGMLTFSKECLKRAEIQAKLNENSMENWVISGQKDIDLKEISKWRKVVEDLEETLREGEREEG